MFEQDLAQLLSQRRADGPNDPPPTEALAHAKRLNAILSAIDTSATSDEVLAWPEQHYVSTSDTCNIECHYCPRQSYYGDRWENGFMPIEEFREHIAPLARHAHTMGLYGLGEPFLHRDFFEFVRASKEAGVFTLTNNHGKSLKGKMPERIVESGLDRLICSMDGATAETFNRLRHGADFETVKAGIKSLVRARDAAGSKTPEVYVATMINGDNLDELPGIVRTAKEVGAVRVDFSDTVICNPEDLDQCVSYTGEMYDKIAEARETGEEIGIEVGYSLQKPFPWRPLRDDEQHGQPLLCELALGTWLVGKRGEVKPCCFIEWEYGNAFQDDPAAIRNSDAAKDLRRRLREGELPRECHGCGCAQALNEPLQMAKLRQAERLLEEADLPEPTAQKIRRVIDERREIVRERWDSERANAPAMAG